MLSETFSIRTYTMVAINEGDYTVRNLTTWEDLNKANNLRYKIFVKKLRWVSGQENGLETDEYDERAVSFGVFDRNNEILAYMRLILNEPLMIEKEFMFLVDSSHKIRNKKHTAEISRFCTSFINENDNSLSNLGTPNLENQSLTIFLLKGVFQWCALNNIRFLYAVTEEKIYRLYRSKGFPFKPIGKPQKMNNGLIAVAVMMDWKDFSFENCQKRPEFLKWIQDEGGPALWDKLKNLTINNLYLLLHKYLI